FCFPVDEAEVPNYRSVISNPMDFQTMQNKLEAEEYRTPEDFKDDLLLVMRNAQTFNPPGSIYSNEAKRIE
ncbi:Bromodomain-containing protein, partial [Ceraceosorus guamensis]